MHVRDMRMQMQSLIPYNGVVSEVEEDGLATTVGKANKRKRGSGSNWWWERWSRQQGRGRERGSFLECSRCLLGLSKVGSQG